MGRAAVFDETYANYLAKVAKLDLGALKEPLGFEMDGSHAVIQVFNRRMHVGAGGITDDTGRTPDLSTSVVLCKYLLMAPVSPPEPGLLKTFKDFADAAPLIHYFTNSVEGQIARRFSGHVDGLKAACSETGGERYPNDWAYQVKYRFSGLPRIPVILLFNDAEEGFGAQCTLLFRSSVCNFLDMESLAILGGLLANHLQRAADLD